MEKDYKDVQWPYTPLWLEIVLLFICDQLPVKHVMKTEQYKEAQVDNISCTDITDSNNTQIIVQL